MAAHRYIKAPTPFASLIRTRSDELGLTASRVAEELNNAGYHIAESTFKMWETRGSLPWKRKEEKENPFIYLAMVLGLTARDWEEAYDRSIESRGCRRDADAMVQTA